jgi:protease-4
MSDSTPDGGGADERDGATDDDRDDTPSGSSPEAMSTAASAPGPLARLGRPLVVLGGTLLAAGVGWLLFYELPGTLADLAGVVLAAGVALAGLRVAGRAADVLFPDYNVAEVAVEGPITREGRGPGPLPGGVAATPADAVVEQIEAADADDAVDALLVRLNTPGGEVVPSDDIRRAAVEFDGPTVAYATDVCASGGYWIASGCDELWARDASLVGSIGVIGSRPNVSDLADRLGVSYERYAAGQYKDAGNPLKEPTQADREYLQGLIDDFYADFVDRVAEGRGMDPDAVRDTEARLYLGREATDVGLVDDLGGRPAVEERIEDLLGVAVSVAEFEPEHGLAERLRGGVRRTAYAFGAGVAGAVAPEDGFDLRL